MQPDSIRKILIVNPYGIGDVLFSSPLIDNLKKWNHDALIYYMCNKRVAPLLSSHPLIHKVIVYEKDDFVEIKKKSTIQWLKAVFLFWSKLRSEKLDLIVDLSLNTKIGFWEFFCGAAIRTGLDFRKRGKFLTHKVSIPGFREKHVTEYYLDTLRALDIPTPCKEYSLFVSDDDTQWARELCKQKCNSSQMLISVAPCGGQSFGDKARIKYWPHENYAALLNKLIAEYNAFVFVLAGPNEKTEVTALMQHVEQKNAIYDATDCSIGQISALVEQTSFAIGNDTGPIRFANALHKKTVAIFGPVDEAVYGLFPNDPRRFVNLVKDIECRPCYKHPRLGECDHNQVCLTSLDVDTVYAEVQKLLQADKGIE